MQSGVDHEYWVWDSSLSVGIEAIGAQHRRIVNYINEIHAAHQKHERVEVSQVLIGLVDYTVTHFAFEEELMIWAGYPLADAHKRAHESFTARINDYIEQHESGQDITRSLLSELQLWLAQHIKGEDKNYAPYVKKVLNKGWLRKRLTNKVRSCEQSEPRSEPFGGRAR
jgi:hemerythrin